MSISSKLVWICLKNIWTNEKYLLFEKLWIFGKVKIEKKYIYERVFIGKVTYYTKCYCLSI